MKSGDLRQEITLMQPAETEVDIYGRTHTRWEVYAIVPAMVQDVSGREFYAAAAVQCEDIVTFSIRYDDGIHSGMRVRFRGQDYDIREVNHLGYRGDFMRIKGRMVQSGG